MNEESNIVFEGFENADRAGLRRGVDPWEIRGFYAMLRAFPKFNPVIVALAAPVVAEIRDTTTAKLGRLCAKNVNERRIRRLLQSRDRDDLARQLSSIIRLIGREANPTEIVETIMYWGPSRRRQLAQDYFSAADDD